MLTLIKAILCFGLLFCGPIGWLIAVIIIIDDTQKKNRNNK